MKRILTGLFSSLLVSAPVLAQSIQAVPGEFIVKYKSTAMSVSNVRAKLSSKASLHKAFPAMGMYHISMKAGVGEAANLEDIKADPDVEYVEPNYIWDKGSDSAPTDNSALVNVYQDSYTYNEAITLTRARADNHFYQATLNTGVENSWSQLSPLGANENKVVVAVVDTGVDTSHKLFKTVANGGANALWTNTRELNGVGGVDDDSNGYVDDIHGWNFITNTSNYIDDDNHGTHVAGIIVGAGQNIFANPLAESKVSIMPLKFLGANGSGTTTAAINAIYYAVNNGADVINNSWGGSSYSRALHEALSYAYDHQVLIVSAAGNMGSNNDNTPIYPANYDVPSNIAVASSTNNNFNPAISGFSNYGVNLVQVASPGEDILSTIIGGKYASMNGTSMAAPFVAGMAALALREDRILTGYQLKQLVLNSVSAKPLYRSYISSGGLIDANNLIVSAKSSVGTMSAYQPDYKAQLRSVASDGASSGGGGCGLVSTAIHGGPGSGGPTPMGGVVAGLLCLPLAVWFVLRRRDPKNLRRHERFRMSSEIRVMVGDRELVGSVNTISQGGLSFNTDQALEKGGIVTMRIASPDGHEVIEVQGQVVWNEQNQAYGVQFANARQGTLAMIQQWTQAFGKPS
ncbi:S8 family serine peptidase [Bdellovibrio svalbardensis]|uniref:S8 family serine peptidase n=1 Tax=Bdellovibrio svalbardensis TaxID=2972972 RepID=A0ABT6DJF3_9BACT|nr:S8 family serine peptidase [Bdellovibrio svalbardensis]MDG0816049.1 S8 family serine peptidase [Bdellovibrio svalbardensis]